MLSGKEARYYMAWKGFLCFNCEPFVNRVFSRLFYLLKILNYRANKDKKTALLVLMTV